MYQKIIRPLLFQLDPEKAHKFTFSLLRTLHGIPGWDALTRGLYRPHKGTDHAVKLWGLNFPNPIGLAAGFDKDGILYHKLQHYGFGFVELGTVTPRPQPGNPAPRLFRLPQDQALINRMGFNNKGVDALVEQLQKHKTPGLVIGGNIGKNKDTPNEQALDDYRYCLEKLHDHVDYFVVNVSSPNTPNLRELQEKEPLTRLLRQLQEDNQAKATPRPILLKIAPDLNDDQLADIAAIVAETKIDGLIATNTTISREGLQSPASTVEDAGAGGLSGKPLRQRSTEMLRSLNELCEGKVPIIAAGGVFTARDAREKLEAGASLVQVYTGFIYEGPGMVARILNDL